MRQINFFGVTYTFTGWPLFALTISPTDWVWIVQADLIPGESVRARRTSPGSPVRSVIRTPEVVAVSTGTDFYVEANTGVTGVCNYDLKDPVEIRFPDGTFKNLPPCSAGLPKGCSCEKYGSVLPIPKSIEALSSSVADHETTFDLDSMYDVTVSSGTCLRINETNGAYHFLGEGSAGKIQVVSKFSGLETHAPALKPFVLGTQAAQWVIGLPYNRLEPLQSVDCAILYEIFQEDEQALYRVRGTIDMEGTHLWQRAGEEDMRIESRTQTEVPDYVQIISNERANLQMPSTCFVEVLE
jgi:hypothetical protein